MKAQIILISIGVLFSVTISVQAQNFVLDGGTLKCDAATVCETNSTVIPGKTYSAVDNAMLNDMLAAENWNGTDPIYVCTSKVTNMANLFDNRSAFNQDIGNWDVS